jgi:hypothetical protein
LAPVKALILTILDPTPKKFSGEVSWVEVDLDPAENLDHLATPEQPGIVTTVRVPQAANEGFTGFVGRS